MKTAIEFNKADTRSKFLKSAMRAKGPAYAEGGEISPAQRSQDFLDRFDAERDREKSRPLPKSTKPAPARSDRRNPDRATITPRTLDKPPRALISPGDVPESRSPSNTLPRIYRNDPRIPGYEALRKYYVDGLGPSRSVSPGRTMTAEERDKLASDNLNYYEKPAHLYEAKKPARRGVFDPHERSEDAAFYRKGGTVSKYARGGRMSALKKFR